MPVTMRPLYYTRVRWGLKGLSPLEFYARLKSWSHVAEQKAGVRVATPQVARSKGTAGSSRVWVSDLLTSSLGLGGKPMTRLRFTLAQLMAIVLYFGFGFAALRNADAVWASVTFSLAIITVSVALAGAFARKEEARMSWAGFAAAGGARLVIWISTPQTVGFLNGPPKTLLYNLQASINPMASAGGPLIAYTQICNSLDVILLGLVGAALGHLLAAKKRG